MAVPGSSAHGTSMHAAGVPFTSGACYADNRRRAAEARIARENMAEAARLAALAANKALPLVFFDVEVEARPPTAVALLHGAYKAAFRGEHTWTYCREHTRKPSTGSLRFPTSSY